ncbi:MAG: ABC transporter ATP-binding protein [Pseudomonadota bacterium]|nr:ABC transporter ATP-binding protein [Pseudomonadota bacterium]
MIVDVRNVSLEYPLYGADDISLRKQILATSRIIQTEKHTVIRALSDISFTAQEGDRIALLGLNGAGKSTLLKALGGVYQPTHGSITIHGRSACLLNMNLPINQELTGLENIRLCCLLLGDEYEHMLAKLDEIAEFSELKDYLKVPVYTYSAGMFTRLAFSIATSIRSDVLLLDEHFGAGDQTFVAKAERKIMELIDQSKTLFFASHNNTLVMNICTKAILLDQGKIAAQGAVKDIVELYKANHAGGAAA